MKSFIKQLHFEFVLFNILVTIVSFSKLSYCEKIDIEAYCTRVHQKLVCNGLDFPSPYLILELDAKELFYELTVVFGESDLATIPHNLFGAFPAAYHIEFVNCKIKSLHKWNFMGGESTTTLNLRSNEIQNVSSEVFATMKDLTELNLQNNLLNEFEVDCFKGLSRLTKLFLSSNNITDIPLNLFDPLVSLNEIHLDDNHIEVLNNDIFKFNKQLNYINFGKNNLKVFSQNIVRHLETSFELVLSFNPIETPNIINYDRLTISHTKIKTLLVTEKAYALVAKHNQIIDVVFINPLRIQKLDLSYNQISNITNITRNGDNIWYLNLSHNPIGRINVKTFSKLTSLRELYLSGTNLLGLDYGSFPYVDSDLNVLDISYNNLKYFDLEILSYQSKLESVYLDGNQLTELNYENLKEYSSEFKEIGLTGNNWNCTFLRKMIINLHRKSIDMRVTEIVDNSKEKAIGGVACTDDSDTETFTLSNAYI